MPLAVELAGVSFRYGSNEPVLEDVDLRVEEGEFVAIAGPNGGGKTTLVRLVLGLERPATGHALLYGDPAVHFGRRADLGYLAQRSVLGVLSVVGNLVRHRTAPEADFQPAAAQVVEHADFLQHPQRVMQWQRRSFERRLRELGGCRAAPAAEAGDITARAQDVPMSAK